MLTHYLSLFLRFLLKLVWGYLCVLREDWPEFGYIFRIPYICEEQFCCQLHTTTSSSTEERLLSLLRFALLCGMVAGMWLQRSTYAHLLEPPQLCRSVLNRYQWVSPQTMNFLHQTLYISYLVGPLWMGNSICKAVNLAVLSGWSWKWKMDLKTIQAMSCLGDVEACVMGLTCGHIKGGMMRAGYNLRIHCLYKEQICFRLHTPSYSAMEERLLSGVLN